MLVLVVGACGPRRGVGAGVVHQAAPMASTGALADASDPALGPSHRALPGLGVRDIGIWSDLDSGLQLPLPSEPPVRAPQLVLDHQRSLATLYDGARAIKVYPLGASVPMAVTRSIAGVSVALRQADHQELMGPWRPGFVRELPMGTEPFPGDRDGDGIVDPLDIVLGVEKTRINAASYHKEQTKTGDVPREIGVAANVVVRALRNAGFDLEAELQEDLRRQADAYSGLSGVEDKIDHRRVDSILAYAALHFEHHVQGPGANKHNYQPGDLVFFRLDAQQGQPDHVGLVSHLEAPSGRPLIVHQWPGGPQTAATDLLGCLVPTHHFRFRSQRDPVVTGSALQLITVISDSWSSSVAVLQRHEREFVDAPWRRVGGPVRVSLGHHGYGWGQGVHDTKIAGRFAGPIKREGDRRSPAGAFTFGAEAFGDEAPPARTLAHLSYVQSDSGWRCVDDAGSRYYGRVLDEDLVDESSRDWSSAEHLDRDDHQYARLLIIDHNT